MTKRDPPRMGKSGQSRAVVTTYAHDVSRVDPSTFHISKTMELSQLAVPSVYGLIFFLGYPSQWMLMHLEPSPLTKNELIAANVVLPLILITYTKAVFVDPGTIPKDWADQQELGKSGESPAEKEAVAKSRKWCRKCDAAKPPRAHHCKECKRYSIMEDFSFL